MNTLHQRLDPEPAPPEGFPAWRAVAGSGEVSAKSRPCPKERAGDRGRRGSTASRTPDLYGYQITGIG